MNETSGNTRPIVLWIHPGGLLPYRAAAPRERGR